MKTSCSSLLFAVGFFAPCATVASDAFAVYGVPNDWGRYTHNFSVSFPGVPDSATLEDFPR